MLRVLARTLILNAGTVVTTNAAYGLLGGGIYNYGTLIRDPESSMIGNPPSDCTHSVSGRG